MNGSLKVVQALILLTFVGSIYSCGGSQTTLGSNTTSGTTTGGNTGQSSGTETIEEEEKNATIPSGYSASNLFVTVPDSIDYTKYTSINSSWANKCSFTGSSIVNDITCTVQAGELALFFDGIKFQYNVPANACSYIGTYPYWYYNHEIGTGPRVVSMTAFVSGTITSALCQVDGGAIANCATYPKPASWADLNWQLSGDVPDVSCVYDTSNQEGGANCCLGKYDFYSVSINQADGSVSPKSDLGKSWGGSVESCIGGAGKTDWELKTTSGYPAYTIEKMTPGVARTKIMKVSPPIQKIGYATNMSIANYYTHGLHTHGGYAAASATTSTYPYFVVPVSDRSGTSVIAGSPHYVFDCLDQAFEVNYRVRMMVQEWDTVAALSSYVTSGVSGVPVYTAGGSGDTGTADDNGTAPTACPGLAGESCNQALDNDDFVLRNSNIPWTSFSNAFPTSRTYYFPKDAYQ